MKIASVVSALILAASAGNAFASEGAMPKGIPALDHVFVIMMENHAYGQIAGNPQAPFTNSLMKNANLATNYFAVAHPSLTNYLEVVGGSNFNNLSDQYPDWHNGSCKPNMQSGITNTDTPSTGLVCPIDGSGKDAATPVLDTSMNETNTPPLTNINGTASIPAESNILGITIADQLVAAGKTWKSYQEGLPEIGADGVNVSDGFYYQGGVNTQGQSVNTNFAALSTNGNPVSSTNLVDLYAVKHDPFAYFAAVQKGTTPGLTLGQVVSFDGDNGLYADLRAGGNRVPDLAFIAPSQCTDMHGQSNSTAFCNFDADDIGTQVGLNPSLIMQGDLEVERIVTAIHASKAWSESKSAIVLLWDENDYSTITPNQVVLVVDTNYGNEPIVSSQFYTHYSLLRTLESAFRLPCLNHACDANVNVMADLFQ